MRAWQTVPPMTRPDEMRRLRPDLAGGRQGRLQLHADRRCHDAAHPAGRDVRPGRPSRPWSMRRRACSVSGATLAATRCAPASSTTPPVPAPGGRRGGTPYLPEGVHLDLELLDERRFAGDVVHLHHRVVGSLPGAARSRSGPRPRRWCPRCSPRSAAPPGPATATRSSTPSRRPASARPPRGCGRRRRRSRTPA